MDRWAHKYMDGQTDGHTDRQTDRQAVFGLQSQFYYRTSKSRSSLRNHLQHQKQEQQPTTLTRSINSTTTPLLNKKCF